MTTGEKRKRVSDYCFLVECSKCLLCTHDWIDTSFKGCPWIPGMVESELARALAIIDDKEAIEKDKNDPINPAHYKDGKIEVIEFIEDKKLGYCLGNAVKYIARAGKKDPTKEVEDLKKAEWYVKRRIKELEEVSND